MDYLIYSIEDDKNISKIINITLSRQGYEVKSFYDAKSFFQCFKEKKPDMILLDMMLPDLSGEEILKQIRMESQNDEIVVIIISANSMTIDKVSGLDAGADDYISKPFDILELTSRVNVWQRRMKKNSSIVIKDICIDPQKMICKRMDKEIVLTKKEFDILLILAKAQGNVVSREELLQGIWGNDSQFESRTIDMHIKSLRKKLNDNGEVIQTIYGVGYKMCL